ncbi:MAG: hypothetical protein AAI946_00455 [Candidatus Hodgkinia cicadicola]
MARRHCKVCALDCDTAVLVGARWRSHQLVLNAKVNMRKSAYDVVMVDAGVSLAQAKSYWRQFSSSYGNVNSAITLSANTRMLFKYIASSLAVGGKLLIMVYSSEFALLANALNRLASALYLTNRAVMRPRQTDRAMHRCSSNAGMLVYIKTKSL